MSDTANPTDKPPSGMDIYKRIREHFQQTAPNTVVNRVKKLLHEPEKPMPGMVFFQGKWISPGDLPPPHTVRDEWFTACPKCGKDDQIDVLASLYVRLTPDGNNAEESHDGLHTWSPASAAKCCACGHSGIVREFTITETESAAQAAVRVAAGLSPSRGGFGTQSPIKGGHQE